MDLNEQMTIISTLENTFNLKKDIVDDNQDNFEITLSTQEKLDQNKNVLTVKQYGTTKITITHKQTAKTKEIEIISIMKIDSLVQGFRDLELEDGEYIVNIKDEIYTVELINYRDNMHYTLDEGESTKTVELGDDTEDKKTLIVKYHKDLIIDEGVTLTAKQKNGLTYKKGMYICAMGNIYNKGEISMTARGTYNEPGQNVYLWKNIDDTYEYVPAMRRSRRRKKNNSCTRKILGSRRRKPWKRRTRKSNRRRRKWSISKLEYFRNQWSRK